MQITNIEAIPFTLPCRRAARFATGARERADHVLVRVHTDEGFVGQAEAQPRPYTYGETQDSIAMALRETLGPPLVGLDPIATERSAELSSAVEGNTIARGALDLAVWDLVGVILGRPTRELLGGFARDVEAAHIISFAEPAAMAAEAVEFEERFGIRTFKVRAGRDVGTDVAAAAAIRNAVPGADLYFDANGGWSYEQALEAGDAIVELGASAIEEPVEFADHVARRRLSERWPIPIVGDESCKSLADVAAAIDRGAIGAVSLKTARTGFTESRRILAHCIATDTHGDRRQPLRGRDRGACHRGVRPGLRVDGRPGGRGHELHRSRG